MALWMKSVSVTILLKAIGRFIAVLLFILLLKGVLSYEAFSEFLRLITQTKAFEQNAKFLDVPPLL